MLCWQAPRRSRNISCLPLAQLSVEPDVFHAIAVVDAVDHRHEALADKAQLGAIKGSFGK